MATRGRPRLGEKPLTSAERKKLWALRMRNDDGSSPGQPRRTPVEIYLREEAREVLRKERLLAKRSGLPPMLDSELVEQLLIWHAAHANRDGRAGLSLDALIERFERYKAANLLARAEVESRFGKLPIPNSRTLKRISELPHRRLTPRELADACIERNNIAQSEHCSKLANELRPVLLHSMKDDELNGKVRRIVSRHIGRIFGLPEQDLV